MLKERDFRSADVRHGPSLSVHTKAIHKSIVVPFWMVSLCLLQNCGGGSSSVAPIPLTVTTSSLPGGTVTISYSATLGASGGTGTGHQWTVTTGTLPAGLSLASG